MAPNTMKALYLNQKVNKVTLETVPIPIPCDDEVLIKVVYAGICGSDLKMIEGKHPFSEMPLILGHEFCGTVAKVGKDVVHVNPGDKVAVDPSRGCKVCDLCKSGRYTQCKVNQNKNIIGVFTNGGFAHYAVIHFEQVFKVPDSIPLEQAVFSEPLSCIAHGYDRLGPLPVGTSILIIGAGIIGMFWASTLHLKGHRTVVISEPQEKRRKTVEKLEMNFDVISPDELQKRKENNPEYSFDVIIECSGYAPALVEAIPLLNYGARLLVFGISSPGSKWVISPAEIFFKEITIIISFVNTFAYNKSLALIQSMGDRYLNYEKLGVQVFPFEKYEDALSALKNGKISKAIFKISQ